MYSPKLKKIAESKPNINDNDVIWFGVINTFNKKGVNMLVKLTQDLKNGFGPWKEMLLANGHKLKEHGMTCIFAATEKDNDNKLTVILDFATPEGMMGFKNDEELTQRRIEAGAMVETTVMTPMTSEAVTNFSG